MRLLIAALLLLSACASDITVDSDATTEADLVFYECVDHPLGYCCLVDVGDDCPDFACSQDGGEMVVIGPTSCEGFDG